jgi:hypothetical protein
MTKSQGKRVSKRVAIYLRVSTTERTTTNQRRQRPVVSVACLPCPPSSARICRAKPWPRLCSVARLRASQAGEIGK